MKRPLLTLSGCLVFALVLASSFESREASAAGGGGTGAGAGAAGAGARAGAGSGDNGGSNDPDKKPLTCEDRCDRAAADCLDTCEETHKGKPLPRVKCKLDCADKRTACVAKCGK
jgi:hypothetical protein